MKASRLLEGRTDAVVEELPDPVAGSGCVVVRVEAAFMPPYIGDLVAGKFPITPARPFTTGHCAVGVVESVGPDADDSLAGRRVYCDMYLESPGIGARREYGFIGCFGPWPESMRLLARWPNGSLAERVLLPEECVVPVPAEVTVAPAVLCRLGWLGTACAGLVRGGFTPGTRVAIGGATGLLGTSAVLVALAMGAGEVVVSGRRSHIVEELAALDRRVLPDDGDREIDLVLECSAGPDTGRTAAYLGRLTRNGALVIVGELEAALPVDPALLMPADLAVRGSFWFPRGMPARLLRLVAAGALDLSGIEAEVYPLAEVNAALHRIRAGSGGLRHVAVACDG